MNLHKTSVVSVQTTQRNIKHTGQQLLWY